MPCRHPVHPGDRLPRARHIRPGMKVRCWDEALCMRCACVQQQEIQAWLVLTYSEDTRHIKGAHMQALWNI